MRLEEESKSHRRPPSYNYKRACKRRTRLLYLCFRNRLREEMLWMLRWKQIILNNRRLSISGIKPRSKEWAPTKVQGKRDRYFWHLSTIQLPTQ